MLAARLRWTTAAERAPPPPRALGDAVQTLAAVAARLLDVPMPNARAVAAAVDDRLARGVGDGWRYDALPPDRDALAQSLAALDAAARAAHEQPFAALGAAAQDELLGTWQRGTTAPALAFEELLAECVECHVADPRTQLALGFDGMADGEPDVVLDAMPNEDPGDDVARPSGAPAWLPPMRRYGEDEEVDVVVIGTGAGGAPLLWRLAAAGLRVVALEAGPWWNAARDFATDERAQSPLYWNDERLSAGRNPVAFGRNNSGSGVGGSTLHFTAYVPRAHADDLRLRSHDGVGEDWPLDPDALAPYYDLAESRLGVSGPSPYPWPSIGGDARRYPYEPLPLNAAARHLARGCDALGMRWAPGPNAALPPGARGHLGQPWRSGCTQRGFCQAGCSTGAKGSADLVWIPAAVAAGAEVRTAARAVDVERAADGRVTAVVYRDERDPDRTRTTRQRCRAAVLAMGAVETPRFLLRTGLATGSGVVGRFFMAHVGLQLWGTFAEPTNPWRGIPGGLISEDTHRPPGADFAGGYLLQSIGVMPVTWASQVARGRGLWGAALGTHLRTYRHAAGVNVLGDCLPHADNRVELSDEMDGQGLPKPRVTFSFGENERRMSAHAERTMRALWDAAGARDVWSYPRTAHVIGGCRMGTQARDSVVDAHGRAWDVPNLWISDNSTWPTALAANPALTITALALRTADHMLGTRGR